MKKASAGLLIYRIVDGEVQVLIAHHGGPLWAGKDDGAWSIFKGEIEEGEEPLVTAKREFQEETGQRAPDGEYMPLKPVKRNDGKVIHAWAVEADYEPKDIVSNNFTMVWPPRSGNIQEFPENDRAEWFDLEEAAKKLHTGQHAFLEELGAILKQNS